MKWHSLQSNSKEWSSPSANCAHAVRHNTSAALTRIEELLSFTFSTHPLGPQWIPEKSGIHKKGRIVQWFLNENNFQMYAGYFGEIRDLCVIHDACPWKRWSPVGMVTAPKNRWVNRLYEEITELERGLSCSKRLLLFQTSGYFSSPTYTIIFTDPTLFWPPRALRHTRPTCMGTYTHSLK